MDSSSPLPTVKLSACPWQRIRDSNPCILQRRIDSERHIRLNPDGTSTAPRAASECGTQAPHHGSLANSSGRLSVTGNALGYEASANLLHVERTVRRAGSRWNQSQPRSLHSSLKKVMRKFAEKYHPGDSIGFAYGLHHDRGTFTRPSRVVSAHSQRPLRGFTAKRNANLFRR
jgi:hypothetical protein